MQGNVDASYTVNGDEISEFRSPANLIGDCIFEFDVNLNIKSSGLYKVKFTISCYYEDKLLPSVVVYEPNIGDDGLFEYKSDGYYHSKSNINGGSTIHLCRGVALNEFDINMDVDKFRLEVQTIVEKA